MPTNSTVHSPPQNQTETSKDGFRIPRSSRIVLPPSNAKIVMEKLYDLAKNGIIMVDIDDLEKLLCESYVNHLTKSVLKQTIKELEEKNLILNTKKQIATNPEQNYISLKLSSISLECVMWVLKSLENDEMSPIERSIQGRFKESFGIKLSTQDWTKFLKAIQEPSPIPDDEYQFDVIEIDDMVTGCKTYSIYPKGKWWHSLDISLKDSEIDHELFNEFINFMKSCFLEIETKNPKESDWSIPGGRYGCAQFVKCCGTTRLKTCSLGQLSQFIQYGITKDILRYKRTLLLWNKNPMKNAHVDTSPEDLKSIQTRKTEVIEKLNMVKQTILEILKENSSGISLAQLPSQLKSKLSFPLDLNELGFVKLKELLKTMSGQVIVELRNGNCPFAQLKPTKNQTLKKFTTFRASPPTKSQFKVASKEAPYIDLSKIEIIRNGIWQLLQEYPEGINSIKLPGLIYTRFRVILDYSSFGCNGLRDFLDKFVVSYHPLEFASIDTANNNEFIIKVKETLPNYNPQILIENDSTTYSPLIPKTTNEKNTKESININIIPEINTDCTLTIPNELNPALYNDFPPEISLDSYGSTTDTGDLKCEKPSKSNVKLNSTNDLFQNSGLRQSGTIPNSTSKEPSLCTNLKNSGNYSKSPMLSTRGLDTEIKGKLEEEKDGKCIWMSSTGTYPLFSYQPSKGTDQSSPVQGNEVSDKLPVKTTEKFKEMAEQLCKSLNLEDCSQ